MQSQPHFLCISTPQSVYFNPTTKREKAGILHAATNTHHIKNQSINYTSASLMAHTFHFFQDNALVALDQKHTHTPTHPQKKEELLAPDMVKEMTYRLKVGNATVC